MNESQNTIIYAALAVILLVVLGSSFYSFTQINALNAKTAELQNPNTGNTAVLIAALTSRVAALEQKVQEQSATAKLLLFYDSSCTFCNNDFMLRNLDQTRKILAQEGIGLSIIDVKENTRAALAVGVRNIPVFFAATSDLSANPKLVDFVNSLAQINFALQESDSGITAFPPTTAKVLQSQSCKTEEQARIEEFYSPTCPYCRPVSYANGTLYNNATTDARFKSLSGDAATALQKTFGSKIELKAQCFNVHTLDENKQVLGINQSDESLCIEQNGADAYAESQASADAYGIPGAPTFVIDCQYITKVRETDKLQQAVCDLRPELCKDLPKPTLPPELTNAVASAMAPNATGNATNNSTG